MTGLLQGAGLFEDINRLYRRMGAVIDKHTSAYTSPEIKLEALAVEVVRLEDENKALRAKIAKLEARE